MRFFYYCGPGHNLWLWVQLQKVLHLHTDINIKKQILRIYKNAYEISGIEKSVFVKLIIIF